MPTSKSRFRRQDNVLARAPAHVGGVVDDGRIEVRVAGRFSAEPSPLASPESASFRKLERTIRSIHPDAIVAPYLVVVATDARCFTDLSANVLPFASCRSA
jgi:carboxypeptidase PM20D1